MNGGNFGQNLTRRVKQLTAWEVLVISLVTVAVLVAVAVGFAFYHAQTGAYNSVGSAQKAISAVEAEDYDHAIELQNQVELGELESSRQIEYTQSLAKAYQELGYYSQAVDAYQLLAQEQELSFPVAIKGAEAAEVDEQMESALYFYELALYAAQSNPDIEDQEASSVREKIEALREALNSEATDS